MKKTPLNRKSPLKANSTLKQNKPLKTKSPLKQKKPLKVNSSLKRSTFKSKPTPCVTGKALDSERLPRKVRSKGLCGHGRNEDHKRIHSLLVSQGCFVCRMLGLRTKTRLTIHHIDGRNNGKKSDLSEYLVICLCEEHHTPINVCGMAANEISVHGNKRRFKKEVGTEIWCTHQSYKLIDECPPWLNDTQWEEFKSLNDHDGEDQWILYFKQGKRGYVPASQI